MLFSANYATIEIENKGKGAMGAMMSFTVQLVVALVLGIYTGGSAVGVSGVFFLPFFLFVPVVEKVIFRRVFWRQLFCLMAFCTGIFLYHAAYSTELRPAGKYQDQYVTMIGRITEFPESGGDGYSYVMDVRTIYFEEEAEPVSERVRVSCEDAYEFGDSIFVSGFLESFSKPKNSGETDYSRYYKSRGIYFRMSAKESFRSGQTVRCYRLPFLVNRIRNQIRKQIRRTYHGDSAAILDAALLGYKKSFSEDAETVLREGSVMRYLYPAYLHLILINLLVGCLVEFVPKRRRTALLLILLALYGVINTNLPVSVKGAGFLVLLHLSKERKGYANYLQSLAVTIGVMLLFSPMLAYDVGMVMAVGCNLIFKNFLPVSRKLCAAIRYPRLRGFLSAWIVSTVCVFPLAGMFFADMNLYALLISAVVLPMLVLLYLFAPLTLLLYPLIGKLCVFLYPMNGIIFLLYRLAEWVQRLPGSSVGLFRAQIVTVVVFYLLLALIRICVLKPNRKLQKQLLAAGLCGFLLIHSGSCLFELGSLRIDFVNVGQGDGMVLSVPFGETILIDGGGCEYASGYDAGEEVYLPYLERNGFRQIDLAIVTHYHSDHCLGILAAMNALEVSEVLIPNCMWDNPYHIEIERLAWEKGIKVSYYTRGYVLSYPSGLRLEILSPEPQTLLTDEENDTSLVVRAEYGAFRALFTGDMTTVVEERYAGEWGHADLLKLAHHGSATSSSDAFLEEVSPEFVLIGVGENNGYHLPSGETLSRLERLGITPLRTDECGDIELRIRKNGTVRVRTYYQAD